MKKRTLITGANIVNAGRISPSDVFISDSFIRRIDADLSAVEAYIVIDGAGKFPFPGRIAVISTGHAPHSREVKSRLYSSAPAGGPLVQHSLVAVLDMYLQGPAKDDRPKSRA
jgi:dihydroorotase-like cyclic amidohydrolase